MNYVKLGLWVGLAAAIFLGGYKVADWRGKAALASLQHAWDVDKAQIQATADAAIAQATKDKMTALAANEGIQSDYQTQLSSARALNGSLADRLRQLQSTPAHSSPVPKAGDRQQPAPTSGTPTMGQIDDAIAAAFTECANNRAQLNSLIAEIRPQL
jgi:hypothetical protein